MTKTLRVLLAVTSESELLKQGIQTMIQVLHDNHIETDIVNIKADIHPCTACGKCIKKRRCIFEDYINPIIDKAEQYDGLVIAGESLYGRADETMLRFVHRLFRSDNQVWLGKPAAVLFASRKTNVTETWNEICSCFHEACMPIITGRHCSTITGMENMEEAEHTAEMLAWILNSIHGAGLPMPLTDVDKVTEFMR